MCRPWTRTVTAGGCLGWVLLATTLAPAADWPQWRGPRRDGSAAAFEVPKVWPTKLQCRWKKDLGEGHASPVVERNRAYVITRQAENEVVRALKLFDGTELWSQSYKAFYIPNQYAAAHGKGPRSTPVLADGCLITLGVSGILASWDAETGKPLWKHDFADQFKQTAPLYGTAMSPLATAGLVIAHLGGHNRGTMAAFDTISGKLRWRWDGDGPGYASPIVVTAAGTRQIVTQSQDALVGISAADGSLLWKLPFKTEYEQNIVTPVVAGDLIIFSGLHKGTTAYRLTNAAQGQWSPEQVWHNADISMYMSTPVVVGSRIFGLAPTKKGQYFCLDAATGKTLWTSDGRVADNASLVSAGDVILSLTTGGELIVFRAAADRFQPLARYRVGETPTWAHPAVLARQVLVKDRSSLAMWDFL